MCFPSDAISSSIFGWPFKNSKNSKHDIFILYLTYRRSFKVAMLNRLLSVVHISLIKENTLSTVAEVPGKQRMYATILSIWLWGMFLFLKCWKHSTHRLSVATLFSSHDWIFSTVTYLFKKVNWSKSSISHESMSKRFFDAMNFADASTYSHFSGWSSADQTWIERCLKWIVHFLIYSTHSANKLIKTKTEAKTQYPGNKILFIRTVEWSSY